MAGLQLLVAPGAITGGQVTAFRTKIAEVKGQSRKPATALMGKQQEVTSIRLETCMNISCTKELNHTSMRELPGGPTKDSQRPEKCI